MFSSRSRFLASNSGRAAEYANILNRYSRLEELRQNVQKDFSVVIHNSPHRSEHMFEYDSGISGIVSRTAL